ncbi:hypothetical protein [Streptomyces chartreusis]|uniref:hypothetical protein n=1 Tax=Streptomyces chartreusis TaxID=1969 RepID=UPI002E18CAAD
MPVEPLPCGPDGGTGTPGDCACAPSIATTPLCRADGTTVLVVVRSPCGTCGTPAADPVQVGWIDPVTGVFTPGAPPADAGPCETTAPPCVETVCRQRCDDTTGDGEADTTYTELWCLAADGTATLLLTYQDDPSTPYAPVSPVECTYGCPERETVMLCDDTGPFLRRYTFLAGTASYEDVALDGQTPHLVQGTVGACPNCSPTPPIATVGLCLADGTPIAVVVSRDCDGNTTRDGWLNLTTGVWSTGAPPAGAAACGDARAFELAGILCDTDPDTGDTLGLVLIEYAYNPDGSLASVRLVDPGTGDTYTLQGELRRCPTDATGGGQDQDLIVLCDVADDGTSTPFVRDYRRDPVTGEITGHTDYALDGTPYAPTGTVGVCQAETEPCRDSSSTLLCDTAALDTVTVFDPANVPGSDGWEIVSYTGYLPGSEPEAPMPYPAPHPPGAFMGARTDLWAGTGTIPWTGYDSGPIRWVMRKTFTAPEDGVAVVASTGFRGDHAARVRVNGTDAGLYGQWNQPATSGTVQIPVTAGPNTIEIEVRDGGGPNSVTGRLDVVMVRTTQFMRRTVVDCETGETVSVTDTTLDGDPYTVTGEVGQCEPVAECCEQPPPETRLDVETALLCVVDTATGSVLDRVLAERVYDDQTGEQIEQRLTTLDGDAYEVPAGAELTTCPTPDRITRQVCVVESGTAEFLTNEANAASGQDTDWQWAPDLSGSWYPMYRVVPNPAWTIADPAPNPAHWVAPHQSKSVCSPDLGAAPNVTATWYTRASWNLPADVDPDTIRIAASILNADNDVVQWRLNDGAWQPIPAATFVPPPWTFPPTAVPGGRAGQNEVIVQITEDQPGVICPSPNQAGMILHVVATYDHAPEVWTQVIEPGGQTYYLDANGDRQDSIPAGRRIVPCGTGGDAPCCPTVTTEPLTLCDVAGDGTATEFLRHLTYTEGYDTPAVRDTLLDGATAYTPTGTVGRCQTDAAEGRDVELLPMCVVDNGTGSVLQRILAEVTYDTATGERLAVNYVDPVTWGPVPVPGGAHIALCPAEEPEPTPDVEVVQLCDLVPDADPVPFLRHLTYTPGATTPAVTDTALDGTTPYTLTGTAGACASDCPVQQVIQACRCDDTDGDGLADTDYVELLAVDCEGQLSSLGAYLPDLSAPYTPVAPVSCEENDQGAAPTVVVQARRVELAAGETWDAAAFPTLQSVTAVARSASGTITTTDGASSLQPGESVTWSVARDTDGGLIGPLVIASTTGTVAVSFTIGVTL